MATVVFTNWSDLRDKMLDDLASGDTRSATTSSGDILSAGMQKLPPTGIEKLPPLNQKGGIK